MPERVKFPDAVIAAPLTVPVKVGDALNTTDPAVPVSSPRMAASSAEVSISVERIVAVSRYVLEIAEAVQLPVVIAPVFAVMTRPLNPVAPVIAPAPVISRVAVSRIVSQPEPIDSAVSVPAPAVMAPTLTPKSDPAPTPEAVTRRPP